MLAYAANHRQEAASERMVRRPAGDRIKFVGWHRGGDHAIPCRQRRSADSRHSALGHWSMRRRASRTCFACALATAERSAYVAALGLCFFGLFFILYNIAIGYT